MGDLNNVIRETAPVGAAIFGLLGLFIVSARIAYSRSTGSLRRVIGRAIENVADVSVEDKTPVGVS